MNLPIKQKQTHRHRELMLTKGERGGGGGAQRKQEFGLADTNHYTQTR